MANTSLLKSNNCIKNAKNFAKQFFEVLTNVVESHKQGVDRFQACGLTNVMTSPKVPNHEILGAQYLSLYEKSTISKFFQLL